MPQKGREKSGLSHETFFDQNISYRIIKIIEDIFPDSKQVINLNLENSTDRKGKIAELGYSSQYSASFVNVFNSHLSAVYLLMLFHRSGDRLGFRLLPWYGYHAAGQKEEAISAYAHALIINPHHAAALERLYRY